MSPTSRNTLMIGGALILVSLLLVCGPLSDRLGSGGKNIEEPPSVAAGPPVDPAPTDEAADLVSPDVFQAVAAGGLVATALAETDVAASNVVTVGRDPVVEDADADSGAGTAVVGTTAAAVVASEAVSAGGAGSGLPPVSAGGPTTPTTPITPNMSPSTPVREQVASLDPSDVAAGSLDDAVAAAMASNGYLGAAGPVVNRFAPPVAAAGGSPLALAAAAQPFGIDSGDLLLPCDSPGSGCRNVRPAALTGGGGGVTTFDLPDMPTRSPHP